MGVLGQSTESFELFVRDVAENVNVNLWIEIETAPTSWNGLEQRNRLQDAMTKRLIEAINNIPSPQPSSIQIRKVIRDVLGIRTSVRKKHYIFEKDHKLILFYDVEFCAHLHNAIGRTIPELFIPETIINSFCMGIDKPVKLNTISSLHITLNQTSPHDNYKF